MAEHHLLLGGCGFIGRHVAVRLAQAGHRVTLADRNQPDFELPPDAAARISWRDFEMGSADWAALVADDPVVHFYAWGSWPATANANPGGDLISNASPLIGLLDAQRRRGGGRVIFSSSGGAVYGRLRAVLAQETHVREPITAYGAGKAAAEIYLGLYRAAFGLDCRIARIANPYGAGQNLARLQGAVTTFCAKALHGEPIAIWGDGEVVRDYVYIGDVAEALVALAEAPTSDAYIFNIGSGAGRSLNEVVREIETQTGRGLDVTRTEKRAFDVPRNVLAIDLMERVVGWRPRVEFGEGVRRTLADLAAGASLARMD